MTHVDLRYGVATHVGLVPADSEDAQLAVPPMEESSPMLLCSDGLSGMLAHDDIARIVVGLTRERPHDTDVQPSSTEQETGAHP